MSASFLLISSVVIIGHLASFAYAGCVCADTAVIMRSGSSTSYSRMGTLYPGYCVVMKGPTRNNQGYYWRNIDYNGQNAWIPDSGSWLSEDPSCSRGPVLSETTDSGSNGDGGSSSGQGCPNIISRSGWGARSPRPGIGTLSSTPGYVFIHHSATPGCTTRNECNTRVRAFQNYHMDNNGWSDIGYSFVVGEDGNVYEGRGWNKVGAHTYGYNSQGIGICIAGDFTNRQPNAAALNTVKRLMQCGVDQGEIRSDYILKGHKDVGSTSCPGNQLYALIRTWPHYQG